MPNVSCGERWNHCPSGTSLLPRTALHYTTLHYTTLACSTAQHIPRVPACVAVIQRCTYCTLRRLPRSVGFLRYPCAHVQHRHCKSHPTAVVMIDSCTVRRNPLSRSPYLQPTMPHPPPPTQPHHVSKATARLFTRRAPTIQQLWCAAPTTRPRLRQPRPATPPTHSLYTIRRTPSLHLPLLPPRNRLTHVFFSPLFQNPVSKLPTALQHPPNPPANPIPPPCNHRNHHNIK